VRLLRSEVREEHERGASALVERYADRLKDYVVRAFRLDGDDADDILFRLLERVARRIEGLDEPDRLGPWLYQGIYNEARKWLTRRKPDQVAANLADLDDLLGHRRADELVFPDEASADARIAEVRAALEPVRERNKEVLSAIISGLSNEEIAVVCGVNVNYARQLRKRALDEAKRRLIGIGDPAAELSNEEETGESR